MTGRTSRVATPPGRQTTSAARDRIAEIGEPWRAALRMAWQAHCGGSIGVGAALTDSSGAIVATGRNRVLDTDAPSGRLHATCLAHAEIDVLAQLPQGDYFDHTLWSTLEPCVMCTSAVVLSHVGTVRYAAADPLWSGIDRLPALNAQVARRWPVRCGPLPGPLGAFCGLLPLIRAIRRRPDGVVVQAYAEHDPALVALGRRLVGSGSLDDLLGASIEEVLERLWADLCGIRAPPRPDRAMRDK